MIFSNAVINAGIYLGTGNSNLGPGIDVDATVGLTTDGAAHGIGDANYECATFLAVAQCHQGVCCFTYNNQKVIMTTISS